VVDLADVRLDKKPPAAKKAKAAPRGTGDFATVAVNHEARAFVRDRESTLDVRGERADDAIAGLERFLDESLLGGREVVFVVHGHGTGALRNAIRAHLQGHKLVRSYRPGEPSEGGDGVTVAFLDASW
jgi:DNA mismatch repair protein MutS2